MLPSSKIFVKKKERHEKICHSNLEGKKKKTELEKSGSLTSDNTTKLEYGTGTKIDSYINGTVEKAQK